jgi:hypothetical protein
MRGTRPVPLPRPRSVRVVHGVGGAHLVQQRRRQLADVGHEPRQALPPADGEMPTLMR